MKIFVTGNEPLIAITKLIDDTFAQYVQDLHNSDPEYSFAVLEQNAVRFKKIIDAYVDLKLETSYDVLIGSESSSKDNELSTDFDQAQICENGHAISIGKDNLTDDKFCSGCGAKVLSTCPKCNAPITAVAKSITPTYFVEIEVPLYCGNCGAPYPWTERTIAAEEEMKRLEEEENIDGSKTFKKRHRIYKRL